MIILTSKTGRNGERPLITNNNNNGNNNNKNNCNQIHDHTLKKK